MPTELYDAVLIVSFGGPEGPDEVLPFLENVLRGRNVPRERLLEVAEHYQHFGGVSPINAQNRALIEALRAELNEHGPTLPIYFGNRNWHPLLPDTLRQMAQDGVQRAIAFFTSAYSSYSGCRQYRENIAQAQSEVGQAAPQVDKLRVFYNHPLFIEAVTDRLRDSMAELAALDPARVRLLFSAHSIPSAMAANCRYEAQLLEASALVAANFPDIAWRLVYQSRSGPPSQPWLEPDVSDVLKELHASGDVDGVVIIPIGFLSDHMEVLYDLDHEARHVCDALGMKMARARTVGTHPAFIRMIRELILERMDHVAPRAIGHYGPSHDVCPMNCCLPGTRPVAASSSSQASSA